MTTADRMKSHRSRNNLLAFSELKTVLAAMPAKYRRALLSLEDQRSASKQSGHHPNSLQHVLRKVSMRHAGRVTSVSGVRRTIVLMRISEGLAWDRAEKIYGEQMVKTACADLVRQCVPKILLENLAS